MLGRFEMRSLREIAAMDAEIQVNRHAALQVMWSLVLTDINKMCPICSPCVAVRSVFSGI